MDVLSSVLNGMRTGRPLIYRVDCHAPWGQRFPELPGVGLHVVVRGSCLMVPASGGDPLCLEVGDVVLLPHGHAHGMADGPGTPFAEASGECHDATDCVPGGTPLVLGTPPHPGAEPSTVMVCGTYPLDQTRRHPFFAELPDAIRLPSRLGRTPRLRSAVDLLIGELGSTQLGAHSLATSLFDAILMYSLRAWYEESACPGRWGAVLGDPVVATAVNAMHTNPQHAWTVESLGAVAGLSRAAFARRFSAMVGQSPLAYLTWWRMTLAARLLRTTDIPMAQIAEQVGYTSEFALAAAFKREFDIPPARYRRTFWNTPAQAS